MYTITHNAAEEGLAHGSTLSEYLFHQTQAVFLPQLAPAIYKTL
jgi:hypothetical protein